MKNSFLDLKQKTILIIGGSSGIGFAVAKITSELGAKVIIASRNEEKLLHASKSLANKNLFKVVDICDKNSIEKLFEDELLVSIDHLVISASQSVHGAFESLPTSDVKGMFASKFWGPYQATKCALKNMANDSSIVLFSGVLSRRPGINCSGLGAVNSAIEGLTRGLALELGPKTRVNCISPGMVRTEAYENVGDADREAMYESTGNSLPVKRVGIPDEVAQAVIMGMTNTYLTGQVIDVDGGHMIRQYA